MVVSAMSFDHWSDQQAGLSECARVLSTGGTLVLADLCAWWLIFTTLRGRGKGRARYARAMLKLAVEAGLEPIAFQQLSRVGPAPIVQALVAKKR